MKRIILLFVTPVLLLAGHATAQPIAATLFDQRSRDILGQYDTVSAPDYYACAVQYARGTHTDRANNNARMLLRKPSGDVFWMLSCMTMYMHGKDAMSREVEEAVRYAWKTYWPYRGDTENHWIMYYSSLFLAAEQWPDLPGDQWFNGLSSKENLEDAKEFLNLKLLWIARDGSMEFDSPTYVPFLLGAMLLLRDFAQDERTRTRADMMCDLLLAEFAVHHLDGQYAGGHSRSTDRVALNPLEANTAGIASLYFDAPLASRTQMEVIAALSSYRIPEIIYRLATDRSVSYEHYKWNPVRDLLRLERMVSGRRIEKYTYMTSGYALSSTAGGIHPIQQHTWGLNISVNRKAYTIFGLHPTWSERELGMFFPEESRSLIAEVSASKSFYTNPSKKVGASFAERVFQYRNTLVALYNIDEADANTSISTFIPIDADTTIFESTGWIVQRFGDVFAALFPLQPHVRTREQSHDRLTSMHLRNGVVLEVRSSKEIGSFREFRSRLQHSKPVFDSTSVSVRFVTLDGDSIESKWKQSPHSEGKVNGGERRSHEVQRIRRRSTGVEIPYKSNLLVLDFGEPRKHYR